MPKTKRVESTALFGLFTQIVFVLIALLLYPKSGSRAVLGLMWYLVPGVLLWLVVFIHARQKRLAREEQEELEELKKKRISEEIFEEQELDRMRAHSGLIFIERYVVPAVSIIISGALLFLAYWNGWGLWEAEAGQVKDPLLVLAVAALLIMFPGFLVGKYAVGLSHSAEFRMLHAPGAYLMGNVVASLVIAFAMAMTHFEVPWLEVGASYFIPGLMALIGVEIILNLILDIYRPRVPGQETKAPYDSRLLSLLAEPGSVLKTLATTLDYQFGFKVSETWFYQFMERAIIPLVLVQLVALWLLSCVLIVKPNEVAFIERFGRPKVSEEDRVRGLRASVYKSGCHLKLPWPFETAHRVPAETIFSTELGKVLWEADEKRTVPGKGAMPMTSPDVILWIEVHVDPYIGYEANFLVPSFEEAKEVEPGESNAPAINLARLEADIQYRLKRNEKGEPDGAAAYEFYYGHADIQRLVADVGYVVMCRLAAGQNFLRWINVDRGEVSLRYQQLLQEELDRLHTGLEVVYAGIPSVHPPAETAMAYEDVIKSSQEKEGMIHGAASTVANITNSAIGRASRLSSAANSYKYRLETLAAAEANRFDVQLAAYRKAPEVYRYRKYFSAVEEVLFKQRLFVVPTTEQEVLMMDLQEKLRADITDIDIEGAFK